MLFFGIRGLQPIYTRPTTPFPDTRLFRSAGPQGLDAACVGRPAEFDEALLVGNGNERPAHRDEIEGGHRHPACWFDDGATAWAAPEKPISPGCRRGRSRPLRRSDRKSTRLNSSH